jgi:hypothetical protein
MNVTFSNRGTFIPFLLEPARLITAIHRPRFDSARFYGIPKRISLFAETNCIFSSSM